jgi:hypothetical protein
VSRGWLSSSSIILRRISVMPPCETDEVGGSTARLVLPRSDEHHGVHG